MNRRDVVQALAACDALATELRRQLKADAAAEFVEQGCAPTWRMPGFTVTASVTQAAVAIADPEAWLVYVAEAYPTEVETVTVTRVRSAWQEPFLKAVAKRGDPPCDPDGRVIPGLRLVPGGEFNTVSVVPTAEARSELRATAKAIACGELPLSLPVVSEAVSA